MKKVLYVTTVSRTINAFLIPHIEMLLDNGYEVDCACSIDKPVDKELQNKGVKIFEVPFSRNPLGIGNIKAFMRLMELQRINNYDIVHVHTPIAAIYGRLLKLGYSNLKTIYTAHGYHFLKGGSKLSWLIYYPIEKIMAKFTDVIININKEDYKITKEKLKPRSSYLLNGVGLDLSKYKKLSNDEILEKKKELGINDNDFVVLMIAELNKNKNHIQLINAIEILKEKYSNIKALCIGDGQNKEILNESIISKNLQNDIFMLGYREDVNKLINISDIGILMSYREGLPRNIMEFMASGRKVIATNIRGCRDLLCNETIGTLVNVGDYEETAKAIEKYYLSRDREFNVSNEIKKYDIESVNSELLKIYESIELEINYEKGMSSYVSNR
ncbi:glycosyltransferase family 4 protein [uncultured Clostridium sp.]|uniref:glycosyltransferase family 4 protein n=1 Tax=uncultured Clostridium sp. TaxID=59620 RepID=UPI0025CE7719|nr:glycosyltransferase family 4 protein [uncultured Clostridium sp.]MDU4323835.1 glycosyltransferase family 4 protein [Clostridium celatum]